MLVAQQLPSLATSLQTRSKRTMNASVIRVSCASSSALFAASVLRDSSITASIIAAISSDFAFAVASIARDAFIAAAISSGSASLTSSSTSSFSFFCAAPDLVRRRLCCLPLRCFGVFDAFVLFFPDVPMSCLDAVTCTSSPNAGCANKPRMNPSFIPVAHSVPSPVLSCIVNVYPLSVHMSFVTYPARSLLVMVSEPLAVNFIVPLLLPLLR